MDRQCVSLEVEGNLATVVLSDPSRRNALSMAMREEFRETLARIKADTRIRAVYLTGAGKSFCAGGDLDILNNEREPWAVHQRFNKNAVWLTEFMRLPIPVVVGVNGDAVGGGLGLALGGDIIIASESARFLAGFQRIGALPDLAVMHTLPRLIGMAQARQLIFSNEGWNARRAFEQGLVSELVADKDLDSAGKQVALKLANGPVEAYGLAKQLLSRTFEISLDEMLLYENLGQSVLFSGKPFAEGVDALLDGRNPNFKSASESTGQSDAG